MKFKSLTVVFAASLLIVCQVASAGRHGRPAPSKNRRGGVYSFVKRTLRCENGRGEPGYNGGGFGECTDFRSRALTDLKRRSGLQLKGSTFEEKTLKRYLFEGFNLDYANLQKTHVKDTTFDGSSLKGAHFEGAKLSHLKFSGGTKLEGAFLDDTTAIRGMMVEKESGTEVYNTTKDVKDFAFANDMIYIAHPTPEHKDAGVSFEYQGGKVITVKLDETTKSWYAIIDLYSQSVRVEIGNDDIKDQVLPYKMLNKVERSALDELTLKATLAELAVEEESSRALLVDEKHGAKVLVGIQEDLETGKKHLLYTFPIGF